MKKPLDIKWYGETFATNGKVQIKKHLYVTCSYYQAIFIKVLLGMVSFHVVKREMEDAVNIVIWQIGNMVFRIDSHAFHYKRKKIRYWQASFQHGHMADREYGYSN